MFTLSVIALGLRIVQATTNDALINPACTVLLTLYKARVAFLVLWWILVKLPLDYKALLIIMTVLFGSVALLCGEVFEMDWRRRTRNLNHLVSYLFIERVPSGTISAMREIVRKTPLTTVNMSTTTNSHPEAAANRSAAESTMVLAARAMGFEPYFIQQSASNQRRGYRGERTYYWDKDLQTDTCLDYMHSDDMPLLVDVDYYMDMPYYLAHWFGEGRPIGLYTMIPTEVAGSSHGCHFTFINDILHILVPGASGLKHQLWNWSVDILTINDWWYNYVFQVERVDVGQHRSIVYLLPMAKYPRVLRWILGDFKAEALHRMKVSVGRHNRLRSIQQSGVYVSIGLQGAYVATKITEQLDVALSVTARTAATDVTTHAVATWLAEAGGDNLQQAATNLLEYYRENANRTAPTTTVFPVEHSVRGYTAVTRESDFKIAVVPFCSPIIHGAFAPAMTQANEKWCVESRVVDIATDTGDTLSAKDHAYLVEFASLLVPKPHVGYPVAEDEVRARQSRPSQRRLLDAATVSARAKRVVRSFLKREAYEQPKPPRPISTINEVDKRDYSEFTYALAEILKHVDWYAFGKTPQQIAERVASVCSKAERHAILTDFSRMDGRVSAMLRYIETFICLRFFAKEYHSQLLDLLSSQHHIKASMTHGVRYSSEWARLSGSPETSLFNTIANAFIAYVALRDSGLSSTDAWRALGVYGGDDGITSDAEPKCYEAAAKRYGQKLEATVIKRGSPGVDFLARWYGPAVWFGDTNSCCDIPRALSKFHVTVGLPPHVTPEMKFFEKAFSLSLTDRETPIISDIVSRALRERPDLAEKATGILLSYWAHADRGQQYPNRRAEWMLDRLALVGPTINPNGLSAWAMDWDESTLLKLPLISEPQPPAPADRPLIVQGEAVQRLTDAQLRSAHVPQRRVKVVPKGKNAELLKSKAKPPSGPAKTKK